jgi:hypothetical protein
MLPFNFQSIRTAWENPHSRILFLQSFFILLLFACNLLVNFPRLYNPLYNYSPQHVLNSRNEQGIPVIKLGEPVLVKTTKCNFWLTPLLVEGQNAWRNEEGNVTTVVEGGHGSDKRTVGCTEKIFRNIPPSRVGVGRWKIKGSEHANLFGVEQQTEWETEWFVIIP